MAAILANPATVAVIAALSQTAIQIAQAIQQANIINAKPNPTEEDWATLDAQTDVISNQAEVKQAIIQGRRDAALRAAPPPA